MTDQPAPIGTWMDRVSVFAAISAVMDEVQSIRKTEKNTQQNYNFRGIDAVVNAVGPALRKHGVVVVPVKAEWSDEHYQTKTGTQMRSVTLTVTFRFYGPAGDFIEAQACGESADSGDKAIPKAHSVAYRTLLLQALCIPTDEPDPDASSNERGGQPEPKPDPAPAPDETPEQKAKREERNRASRARRMRDKIEGLAREADTGRVETRPVERETESGEVEMGSETVPVQPGTTWAELLRVIDWAYVQGRDNEKDFPEYGADWESLTEEGLVWLGGRMADYVAAVGAGSRDSFHDFVTVPF